MGKILDRISGHPEGWEGMKREAGVNTDRIPASKEVSTYERDKQALASVEDGARVHSADRYTGLGGRAAGSVIDVEYVNTDQEVVVTPGTVEGPIEIEGPDHDLPQAPSE